MSDDGAEPTADDLAAAAAALDGSVALTGTGRSRRAATDRVAVEGVVARATGVPREGHSGFGS